MRTSLKTWLMAALAGAALAGCVAEPYRDQPYPRPYASYGYYPYDPYFSYYDPYYAHGYYYPPPRYVVVQPPPNQAPGTGTPWRDRDRPPPREPPPSTPWREPRDEPRDEPAREPAREAPPRTDRSWRRKR
jgi:hypothetical protein